MKKLASKVTQRPLIPALLILCLVIIGYYILPAHLRSYMAGVNSFADLDLTQSQRILVFAPHNDDETLGSAGLIQNALAQGKQVRVVIATNGDGYVFATMEEFHTIFPSGGDYIHMGDIRQSESIKALSILGVKDSDIYFLGYPDRGTPALWSSFWDCSVLFRSPYTETSRSLYTRTYNPSSKYCGSDLLQDLRTIFKDYRPDTVILPHPEDVHPDHWGLSNFVRLAISAEESGDVQFHPAQYAYLVHRPDFPTPSGLHPADPLMPPYKLLQIKQDWEKEILTTDQLNKKKEAVLQYRSQLPLLRNLLDSFIRTNELFEPADLVSIPFVNDMKSAVDPTTWLDDTGNHIFPVVEDPINDFITRDAIGDSDIVSVYIALDHQNGLHICGQLKDEIGNMPTYRLQVKGDSASQYKMITLTHHGRSAHNTANAVGKYVCGVVDLADLKYPQKIMVGFDTSTSGLGTIDQIGWPLIDLASMGSK